MMVLMSNTYLLNDNMGMEHLVTGLIGVFDTKEKAMDVWSEKLTELSIPDWEQKNYMPDVAGRTMIRVGQDGQYIDGTMGYFVIELMSMETRMNKVLGAEDSTILNY